MSDIKKIKRIKVDFAPGIRINFTGRDLAIKKIFEWAEKGVGLPIVVYGPEGCGKTAWLRQSIKILEEEDFKVVYVNSTEKIFEKAIFYTEDLKNIVEEVMKGVVGGVAQLAQSYTSDFLSRLSEPLTTLVLKIVYMIMRKLHKPKIAVFVDEAFQNINIKESALYVKAFLNMIEHPPAKYEKMIAVITTSEGLSRAEIGRHEWSYIRPMWNMSKNDFRELYDQIPGEKPSFEDIWRLSGGNLRILRELYMANWDVNEIINDVIDRKRLEIFIRSLDDHDIDRLHEATIDPDVLFEKEGLQLLHKLVEMNLIIDDLPERDVKRWIDLPPSRKDLEIGVGEEVAWQTPIYREAVKMTLKKLYKS
jgi:molybdopterin-guanine dinucleotide biosynthesis protein